MKSFFRRLLRKESPQTSITHPTPVPAQECVRFKAGVQDADFGVDMGGWQGRVSQVHPEDDMVTVAFDSVTLRAMPPDYIERSKEEGLGWEEYRTVRDELEAASPRDTPAQVKSAIAELNARYAYSHLGDEGREMNAILAGVDPADPFARVERWQDYLQQRLTFPFEARVAEALFFDSPVHLGDRLQVTGIDSADEHYGVLANVTRGRDTYVYPFCDLEPVKRKSSNRDPLQLYRVWYANR